MFNLRVDETNTYINENNIHIYIYSCIFIYSYIFCLPPECLLFYISPRDLVAIMGSIEKEGTKIYDTLAGVQGEGNKGLLKDVEDFSFYHNTHFMV